MSSSFCRLAMAIKRIPPKLQSIKPISKPLTVSPSTKKERIELQKGLVLPMMLTTPSGSLATANTNDPKPKRPHKDLSNSIFLVYAFSLNSGPYMGIPRHITTVSACMNETVDLTNIKSNSDTPDSKANFAKIE